MCIFVSFFLIVDENEKPMKINIRQERETDHKKVFDLIKSAFAYENMSDHREHFLVERLRKSSAFIPELSIVAEFGPNIVGHILLTRSNIKNDGHEFESLALAPVSVLPEYQGRGIGGILIEQSHKTAKELGFRSIVLLGHEQYYPKFGYRPAHEFGITLPFDAPEANCMAVELIDNALQGVSGTVEYPKEFYE